MRFDRQEILSEIGKKGQKILQAKKIAIVGVGALGTVAAELLVRSGIGEILLVDRDVIEESNLQRQMLFNEKDLGQSKAKIAEEKLKDISSITKIRSENAHLSQRNITLLEDYDLILDCTDNLKTRFLINDFCRKNKMTWIYSAAIKTEGMAMPIFPEGPCLSCFLKEANLETCEQAGVLNTITSSVAALQVTLALKIILNQYPEKNLGVLYHYNIWNQQLRRITVKKMKDCAACQGNFVHLNREDKEKFVHFCGSGRYQIESHKSDIKKLKEKLVPLGAVMLKEDCLRFKELTLFSDGRALIKAKSQAEAETIYSKYVGN